MNSLHDPQVRLLGPRTVFGRCCRSVGMVRVPTRARCGTESPRVLGAGSRFFQVGRSHPGGLDSPSDAASGGVQGDGGWRRSRMDPAGMVGTRASRPGAGFPRESIPTGQTTSPLRSKGLSQGPADRSPWAQSADATPLRSLQPRCLGTHPTRQLKTPHSILPHD